jgi:3-dehydroquinate synthase
MKEFSYHFSGKETRYYLDAGFADMPPVINRKGCIVITDTNLYQHYAPLLEGWQTIVIPAGEQYKQQSTIDDIIRRLIEMEADRTSFIIGMGGGVVTDIAGYVAGIYLRGVRFALMPTSILAMVDAAIGGKNGIDIGIYKNLVGLIRQPDFILYDYSLLDTLPAEEWVNGFAEVIKHACIKDATLFELLQSKDIAYFKTNKEALGALIERNIHIKSTVVAGDERESGERRLLNFGHTFGHAIENLYQLPHGHAVSIGMVIAAAISQEMTGFSAVSNESLVQLLQQYQLPVQFSFDKAKAFSILKMDKKREKEAMNFILLQSIGEGIVQSIPLTQMESIVMQRL